MSAFYPPRIIESDELLLRPFIDDDAQQLFETLLGDPVVTEWLSFPTHSSVEVTHHFIEVCRIGWNSKKFFTWALQDKATQRLIGAIDLTPRLPRVEIGVMTCCRLGHRRRRAGLKTLRQLIDWLMAQPQILRLDAYCAPQGGAASTMTRLGFSLEGRLVNWEARPNRNLPAGDSLVFAMTRTPDAVAAPAMLEVDQAVPA